MNKASFLKHFSKSLSLKNNSLLTYATFNVKRVPKDSSKTSSHNETVNRFDNDLQQYVLTAKNLSDIQEFKQSIISKYQSMLLTEKTFDAIFMRICLACRNFKLGKTFMEHLTQSGKQANIATCAKYLTLCYYCRKDVEDKSEIENLCMELQSSNSYLDGATKESIILGLSITEKWHHGLKLLDEDESTHHSLPMNAMVDCLLKHEEQSLAMSWMDKIIFKQRTVYDFVYEHWIMKCTVKHDTWAMFSDFISRNQIFLKEPLAEQLKNMLERRTKEAFSGQFTTVDKITGKCLSCHRVLQNVEITDEDFASLRKRLTENVLVGPDVFIGSKPEELERFYNFIKKTAPFDVVIDGLNVAYTNGSKLKNKNESLHAVVNHFARKRQRILVLSRKHLLREPALSKMRRQAFVFLTENISRDDPFLLYAAVQSKHTKFVSDDLFRDHLFRLADAKLEAIFKRWQQLAQRQIIKIGIDGSVELYHPPKYQTSCQVAEGYWHIPYDDGTPRFSYQLPNTWLCLQPKI